MMTRAFRPRYILFSITADENVLPIPRKDMIATLRLACNIIFQCSLKEKHFYLTRFNGEKGVLRCKHTQKQSAITLLTSITHINSHPVSITTIATSGTIKTLLKKHDADNSLSNKRKKD